MVGYNWATQNFVAKLSNQFIFVIKASKNVARPLILISNRAFSCRTWISLLEFHRASQRTEGVVKDDIDFLPHVTTNT